MSKASESRAKWAVGTTYLVVSIGFAVRNLGLALHGVMGWIVWVVGLPLSIFLLRVGTDAVWNSLIGRERRRKSLLSDTWIEGTWLVQTFDHAHNPPKEVQTGLAEFSYKKPDLDLSCNVTSVRHPNLDPVETAVTCIILANDLHYLHSFERRIGILNDTGVAYGTFIRDGARTPQRYSGHVMFINSERGHVRTQIGRKLSPKEVQDAQATFGNDATWRPRALQNREWIKSLRQPIGELAPPQRDPAGVDLVH